MRQCIIVYVKSIVVTSGKGGVGKTTVTACLGRALAELGCRVVLIDADFGLNNLDVVLGAENSVVYVDRDSARSFPFAVCARIFGRASNRAEYKAYTQKFVAVVRLCARGLSGRDRSGVQARRRFVRACYSRHHAAYKRDTRREQSDKPIDFV